MCLKEPDFAKAVPVARPTPGPEPRIRATAFGEDILSEGREGNRNSIGILARLFDDLPYDSP